MVETIFCGMDIAHLQFWLSEFVAARKSRGCMSYKVGRQQTGKHNCSLKAGNLNF